jgi:hypothetical protein
MCHRLKNLDRALRYRVPCSPRLAPLRRQLLGLKARAGRPPKYSKNALSLGPFSQPYRVVISETCCWRVIERYGVTRHARKMCAGETMSLRARDMHSHASKRSSETRTLREMSKLRARIGVRRCLTDSDGTAAFKIHRVAWPTQQTPVIAVQLEAAKASEASAQTAPSDEPVPATSARQAERRWQEAAR